MVQADPVRLVTGTRRAIIVGSGGQDGRLLAAHLRRQGYELTLVSKYKLDIADQNAVLQLVRQVQPQEIYLLAAHHHSAEEVVESDEVLMRRSLEVHTLATTYFLEAVAQFCSQARLFFASSSHIFPSAGLDPLNEETVPSPSNIYAITKYAGMLACRYYRERRGVFACCGILFNHESSLRPPGFLSRKITAAAVNISRRQTGRLTLGNLDAAVDWGYAPDYVDAMHRILQVGQPSDYVVATGVAHTVREFAEIAFRHVGLDYHDFVDVCPEVLTKPGETRIGDPTKLMQETGWRPSVAFEEMVAAMVEGEIAGYPKPVPSIDA